MAQSAARYEPLSYSDEELPSSSKDSWTLKPHISTRTWAFFVAACILSLVFSALSLSALASTPSFNAVNRHPTKTPSVYLGLEHLKPKERLCRGRGSYPWEFYTFTGSDTKHRTHVHAPKDKVNLVFGGQVGASAAVEAFTSSHALQTEIRTHRLLLSRLRTRKLHSHRAALQGRRLRLVQVRQHARRP